MRRIKMKKAVIFSVVLSFMLVFLLQTGCIRQVRYSETEIQGYPANIQEHIRKGEIYPGMTNEQVRYAWGNPDFQKILDPYEGKPMEEWIYTKLGIFGTKILVFYDSKLIYVK
jgi:outer membrane protein assembly factor BamE (lipoprotein component of BamABCDE complex)